MNAVWSPYCGPAPDPATWLARWNFDPLVLAGLLLIGGVGLWCGGARRAWWPGIALVLAISFVSPLCALSSALFSARTVHHLLLILIAVPLAAWALPRVRLGLAWTTALQAAVLWAWHAPAAYGWALSNDLAYWLMQVSLGGTALLFWRAVRGASGPAAVLALLAAMVAMGLLGALIAFAGQPLYAPHLIGPTLWDQTPLEDQQAAGLIMWAPAAGLYLVAALIALGRWIGPPSEARAA